MSIPLSDEKEIFGESGSALSNSKKFDLILLLFLTKGKSNFLGSEETSNILTKRKLNLWDLCIQLNYFYHKLLDSAVSIVS